MTEISDLIRQLIDAGTPPDVSAIVVAEAFARGAAVRVSSGSPVDMAAENRRAWDRERKALQREAERKSTGSPPDFHPKSANVLSLSDSKESKKERTRGSVCPVDFLPSESHYERAVKRGIDRAKVNELCEDMRSWSVSNANRQVARKNDWDMTLHVWIKRFADERAKGAPKWNSGMDGVV